MVTKICRVCGKEYPACRETRRNPSGTFRWQEVACSYECGCIYFDDIKKSRVTSNDDSKSPTPFSEAIENEVAENDNAVFDDIGTDEDIVESGEDYDD